MDEVDLKRLLQPTITAEMDEREMAAPPFSSQALFFASFFCGPLGGGALWCWNFHRIGKGKLIWVFGLFFIAVWIANLMLIVVGTREEWFQGPAYRGISPPLVGLLSGYVAFRFQALRLRSFRGEHPNLLGYGVLALVAAYFFDRGGWALLEQLIYGS